MKEMLKSDYYTEPSDLDRLVFEKLVPAEHLLRQVKQIIDFDSFRDLIRDCYSADMGRTAEDPVRLIKLEYLQFQYNLSDREVLKQVQVNVAFRFFLDLALESAVPTPGLLSQFRTRLGVERHQRLFEEMMAQARARGLVKDRLRLKDATHVLANIAVPSAIQLIAQTRNRLLESAQPYEPARVQAEEQRVREIRTVTDDLKDEERLLQRLTHLRQIVLWADERQQQLGPVPSPVDWTRARFEEALQLAHRVLDQTDDPRGGDRVRSAVDPDARRGKHGEFYDGYQLDLAMDADSELITAIDTPPANADEAANAARLIEQEEQAQGNAVAALSIDGIGFRGDVLRTLQDPQGLGLEVYVPPAPASADPEHFPAEAFRWTEPGRVLICPAEETTATRFRNTHDTGWVFEFARRHCVSCPLQTRCVGPLPAKHGRRVYKNDYEAEYQAARARAQSEAYAAVRAEHAKVERKLAELVRYHGGRRARYWGRARVRVQYVLTALVVNIKRMVRLLGPAERSLLTPERTAG